jgi:DGQHR domain-containing protein
MSDPTFVVRAVRTKQGGHPVYAFFVLGKSLLDIADVRPLAAAANGRLDGFQRPRIREQIRAIGEYLARGPALFPNAIILALTSNAHFVAARGTKPTGIDSMSEAGTLTIPLSGGRPAACIVDGQQRTLALAESRVSRQAVPVIAFVSDDIATHREQFILVNRARPLPARLIDELLPEVTAPLPRDLSARRVPNALCSVLNTSPESPFRGLIRRPSMPTNEGVVTDSALVRVMSRSIRDPRGALAAHVSVDNIADAQAMFTVMVTYWSVVAEVFPEAWGLPPDRSRLMHSAGIEAMGVLMDQIMTRQSAGDERIHAHKTLSRIAPSCRWTSGRWESLDRDWNDIQSTRQDIRLLANTLISLERAAFEALG